MVWVMAKHSTGLPAELLWDCRSMIFLNKQDAVSDSVKSLKTPTSIKAMEVCNTAWHPATATWLKLKETHVIHTLSTKLSGFGFRDSGSF